MNLEEKYPDIFVLRVGYSCNNKCIHCFVENKRTERDLTFDEIKKVIDSSNPKSLLIVTGGEPTVRPDLLEILKYIKARGTENNVQSNGMNFFDEDYVKKVGPFIDSLTIPVHSSSPEIFDSITQVRGSFEKTIQGLKNLKKNGVRFTTQTVINQLNYKSLLSTYDLIQTIDPGVGMTLTFPHPISAAYSTEIVPRFSEITGFVRPVLKKYAYLMHTHYLPKCVLYPYQKLAYFIDDSDTGSTYKPGIDFINNGWVETNYGVLEKGSRVKSTACLSCRFNTECIGVWKEYGELYKDLDMVPIRC